MQVRAAEPADLDCLASIWFEGWHDAHARIVPAELTRIRTLDSFAPRLQAALTDTRVVGPPSAAVGFCIIKGDELYQLYVAPSARGSGVAASLLADGEARLSRRGIDTAWLACAIGNDRAARFYERRGWHRVGTMVNEAETPKGPFLLDVWRYEKWLTRGD